MTEGKTYVIAEIGVNHDGSLAKALELVEAVATTGSDAVKIQTFTAASLVSSDAPKAAYQLVTTPAAESQFEMLHRLELSRDDHRVIMDAARSHELDFLSTPYDRDSLAFLVDELGVDRVKIASSDLTNLPLLLSAGRSRRRIIVSTGMATLPEIHRALAVLGFGASTAEGVPSRATIDGEPDAAAREYLASSVVLLQCTSQYPAPLAEANLLAMVAMRENFGVPVGYSDHTVGTTAAVMSVALGSTIYERHFTLDRTTPGPDHSASMEPSEFAALVTLMREAEVALGTGIKEPSASESGNRFPMRKSLMAARDIAQGQVVEETDIALMRPESGDLPEHYWAWQSRTAPRAYRAGDPLRAE